MQASLILPGSGARGAAVALAVALLGSPAAAAPGDPLWEREIDARTTSCPSAVAAGGVLYTWSNVLFNGTIRPLLQARRVRSGKLLWEANGLRSHRPAGPIVEGDGRLFTAEQKTFDKMFGKTRVTARDAITGRVAWTAEFNDPLALVLPTGLAAAGGRLFLFGRLGRSGAFGSFSGVPAVFAYDGMTGKPLWSDVFLGARSGARTGGVVADRKRTVVDAHYAREVGSGVINVSVVRTYDAATGRLLWQRKNGLELERKELHRDRLFLSGSVAKRQHSLLRALAAETGRELWRRRIGNELHTLDATRRAVVVYGQNHFRSPDDATHLRTFDRETGRPLWLSTEPGAYPEPFLAGPNRVFTVTSFEPRPTHFALDAYDARTGRRLWSSIVPVPEGTRACEAVRERGVLVYTENAFVRERTILRAFAP